MIIYWERTETVPMGEVPDFARILYVPATEAEDKADLVALIPKGKTQKHFCNHDSGGSCTVEII